MMRQRTMEEWKGRLISFGLETLGGFLVAVALDCFAVNAAFPLTGFSGIALIVNRLWGLPIGATTVLLNIPLAFLCYKLLGRGFFLRSMRCMVISSIFIDYIGPMLPAYDGDRLLAALCTAWLGRGRGAQSWVRCILAALMPVVFNFVLVGAVLTWSLTDAVFPHLNASFWVFGGQVALGEVAVLGVLGLPLMRLLPRNPKFREIIRSYQKE